MTKMTHRTNPTIVVKIVDLDTSRIYSHMVRMDKISSSDLKSTKLHPNKTPKELFFGKKPLVAHLRVFGSIVYVHNKKSNQGKLATHNEKCTLLSHDDKVKAYYCYQPSIRKVKIMEIFNPIILDNDIIAANNINSAPLCAVFVPISTLNFNYLPVVIIRSVGIVSPSPNSSSVAILDSMFLLFITSY